ncbi:hypothetical protein RM190_08820 [Paracoccus sp. CPCC 101403]|uniref:Tse2 ADP-ribosyltransferase toxin domain-containing protein n=2 Tax=Paracoccus broussonetiae TaxID=3075834 RepID=A0ABU3EEU9_9RHOB|nr:hypothetical protein [Paracoccus sp. CPCC 101403]MDT1061955.1 hypothetical protein [Paracoccus sp. CPCC 101403]
MANLDKDYFRAVNKSSMDLASWKLYAGEYFQGVLDGDIEKRSWTVNVKGSDGSKKTEIRSRQDWAIRGGTIAEGAGTSIHDVSDTMSPPYLWKYFKMPSGTPVPATLKVVQRGRDAHHYQIEVATGGKLTPDTLRGALDNLARACVAREVELSK